MRAAAGWTLLALLGLLAPAVALYEDQIGGFDWRQTYIGKLKFAHFDAISAVKKIIVATEENVIAALNLKTGQILWRHILEGSARGNIQMLHVAEEVITVSGSSPSLIRGWDLNTGHLIWEWSLWLQGNAQQAATFNDHWWVENKLLHHLLPVSGNHLEYTTYNVQTGQNRGATSKLNAPWVNYKCVFSVPYYTCITGENDMQLIKTMDVTSNILEVHSKPVSEIVSDVGDNHFNLLALPGDKSGVIVNNHVVLLKSDGFYKTGIKLNDDTTSFDIVKIVDKYALLQSRYADESLHVAALNIDNGSPLPEYSNSIPLPGANYPKIISPICAKTAKNNLACRLLVAGEDSAVYLLQNPGKMVWVREEALSKIVGVEMLDLPISELEAVIETEFDNKEGDILGMFTRRIKSQIAQLKTLSNSIIHKLMPPLTTAQQDGSSEIQLVRDEFGLHKLIIVVTESGKVFGIDNLSGNIIWKRYIPFLSPFASRTSDEEGKVVFYNQRTTRHLPYEPQCTIVARHRYTGEGMLFMFNPITGAAVDLGIANLSYRIKQTAVLQQMNAEFLKGIVVMDEDEGIHVYPPSSTQLVGNMYMFVANPTTGNVQGFVLNLQSGKPVAVKTWLIRLGGGSATSAHKITNIAFKNPVERVHSQGKVMGDRSVLYKYINPNLVAITTEGPDPVHKDIIYLYLVDVVSGAIIMVQSHKRARGPVKVVHSENWLVYSYYSEKSRRPEIATIELYEGPNRSGGAFSSLDTARWPPEVARQAYVLPAPAPPLALATTITDRGITAKDILISMGTGQIVELPWVVLDPRRPTIPMTNEMREEGLLQYTPELPLPSEAVINYNLTVLGVKNVHTFPSGLESTCLVFAYGLDIFYTRVAPSKTFDLLNEDFDYSLIILVLFGLIVSSYAAKRFASRKVLRQAWK